MVRFRRPHGSALYSLCWTTPAIARGSSAWTSRARIAPTSIEGSACSRHATLSGPKSPASITTSHNPSVAGRLFDRDGLHHVADLRLLGDVDPVDDVPEEVVVLLQLRGAVVDAHEELRSVGVGAGIGHRHRAEGVLAAHGLVGELVTGAAAPGAIGVAALDHERGHDTVEREPVVVALTGERNEVVHALRRHLRIEL